MVTLRKKTVPLPQLEESRILKLVLSRKRLTEKALTLKVNLDESANYHELVMVAENLGEIPPNTSLMVVKAGKQQYEVRITSTEQKNAVVVFKFQP